MQTRHYGIEFDPSDIPMFPAADGLPERQAYLKAPEEHAPYWRWSDGYHPETVHPTPVSRELAERAIRAWLPTWGHGPEVVEAEVALIAV